MTENSTSSTHSIRDGICTRCGCSSAFIERFSPTCDDRRDRSPRPAKSADAGPRCPKCKSTSISANKAGFGLGKAVAGGVALGPAGLLAGFFGSRKVYVTCLSCGHSWKAGAAPKKKTKWR
jgi:hypothetical protein